MHHVIRVKPLPAYRLFVEFADGVKGEVDLSDRLFGTVFEPLKDPEFFSQAGIDQFGVVCWPNGADLAHEDLHQTLTAPHADA